MAEDNSDILRALEPYRLKPKGRGEYRCFNPLPSRSNSDSGDSFTFNLTKGTGHDMVTNEGYSATEMRRMLNLPLPLPEPNGSGQYRQPVSNTRRVYRDLQDYAIEQGVEVEYFEAAKWKLDTHQNRPCFSFPTVNGMRYRFIDGGKPKYTSQTGYKECWYGLDKAISMNAGMIILVNGEASTIVGQRYGVPAFCKTAGERAINDKLMAELKSRNYDGAFWIALDCDQTGRSTAQTIKQAQLPDAFVLDLGLTDGGDLANFCKLHTHDTLPALQRLIPRPRPDKPDIVYAHSVAINAIADIEKADDGYALITPFPCLHSLGGYAHVLEPGILAMVVAPTGSGKTSWLETWTDYWNKRGIGGVWRGDEFTPQTYHNRKIQRYGGIPTGFIRLHKQWLREERDGIPPHLRTGIRLDDKYILHYQEVSDALSEWSGKLAYYEGKRENKFIEPMLDILTRDIEMRRSSGEIVGFAIFDYIQLLRSRGAAKSGKSDDDNVHEYNLGLLKEWTIDMCIVSIVGSQMTKSASDAVKRNSNVESYSPQWVRTDKANLVVYPRLNYEDGKPNGTGFVHIGKNSDGIAGVDIAMIPDFERLQWVDPTA